MTNCCPPFVSSHAFGHNNAFYGEGHGPVITYNLNCDGSEADIASCPSSGTWHTSSSTSPHCAHSKDVGVNCKGGTEVNKMYAIKSPRTN